MLVKQINNQKKNGNGLKSLKLRKNSLISPEKKKRKNSFKKD